MLIVRLLKSWKHDEKTYKAYDDGGTDLKLPDEIAKTLIDKSWAEDVTSDYPELIEPKSDDSDTKTVTEPEPQGADKSAADLLARISELETKIAKMASTPANQPKKAVHHGIEVMGENWTKDPKRGFKHMGDFLRHVQDAAEGGAGASKEITRWNRHTKTVGSDEYVVVEDDRGGYLIPPEFRQELLQKEMESEFVRANGAVPIPTQSTMVSINAEVDANRTGELFGGVDVYWLKERGQMTAKRGQFEQIELKPKALTGLAYVTDRMLFHSPAIGGILNSQFMRAFLFKETAAFTNGTGAGNPMGMWNAANLALISVTRATSSEVNLADVLTMKSQCYDYDNAVWVVSRAVEPFLWKLALTVGAGGAPVMLFNLATQSGIPTLGGRPVIFSEHASALGSQGDFNLIVPRHYLIAETAQTVADSSIHVRYEYNETGYRFVKYLDAAPWWRSTLTLKNSFEVSPFITLAA